MTRRPARVSIATAGAARAIAALLIVIVCGRAVCAADDDAAQQPGRPVAPASAPPAQRSPDFRFGAPRAWLSVRGMLVVPRLGGDLFTFVTDQLTLDRSSFRAGGFAADVGIVLTPRMDIVAGFDRSRSENSSEYRGYIASNSQPIAQVTVIGQTTFSAGVRFSPTGRGRRISRYAFIPQRFTPYAGAGATVAFYSLSQQGQFVDFADLSVFTDRFVSDGWGVGPYVNGGVDIQVWKWFAVTFDGRYSWMQSELDSDFIGFDGIDLAGFRGSTGVSVVF